MKKETYRKSKYIVSLAGFLMVLLFHSCSSLEKGSKDNQPKAELKTTIIKGLIDQPSDTWIRIYSPTIKDTVTIDKEGRFKFQLALAEPCYLSLVSHYKSIKIFLNPGDTLKVGFNPENLPNSLLFKGESAGYNNYLKSKNSLLLDLVIPSEHLYAYPPKQFKFLVDSSYVVQKINLEMHLAMIDDEPEFFTSQEKASIWYDRATKMYEYLHLNEDKFSIDKSFYSFKEHSNPNMDSLLNLYEYRTYLTAWINYITIKQLKESENQNYSSQDLALKKMQLTVKNIQSIKVKNYLLHEILSEQIAYFGYKNSSELFQLFSYQCVDEALKSKLMKPYQQYEKLTHGTKAPALTFYDANNKTFQLSDFSGSFLYIDVWATWCLPCKKQAPYFEALALANSHKNIKFISLSIDKEEDDWKDYLLKKPSKVTPFIIRDIESFLDAYQIKTIPHFLIIDNKGQLIDANAPKPSEKNHSWLDAIPSL